MNRHRSRAILETIPSAFIGSPPQEYDPYKLLDRLGLKDMVDSLLGYDYISALDCLAKKYRFEPSPARSYAYNANYIVPRGTVGYMGSRSGAEQFLRQHPDFPCVLGFSDEPVIEPKLRLLSWDNFSLEYYQCIEALYLEDGDFHELEAKLSGIPVWCEDPILEAGTIKDSCLAAQRELYTYSTLIQLMGFDWAFPVASILPAQEYPLVSICMNCYNRQSYVPLALLTLIYQSYPNLELIVVDDASTDNSAKVIDRLIDESCAKVNFIKLKQNVGCAEAWNIGIREASGKYLYYASSDNIHRQHMIMNLMWGIIHHKCNLVYSRARHFGGYSGDVHTIEVKPEKTLKGAGLGSAFLIDMDYAKETELMHSDERYVEDTSWTYDLLMCGAEPVLINESLIYYRVDTKTSLTKDAMKIGYNKLMGDMAARKAQERKQWMDNLYEAIFHYDDYIDKSQLANSLQFLESYGVPITALDEKARLKLEEFGIFTVVSDKVFVQNKSQKSLIKIYINGEGRYSRCLNETSPRGYGDRIYLYNKS